MYILILLILFIILLVIFKKLASSKASSHKDSSSYIEPSNPNDDKSINSDLSPHRFHLPAERIPSWADVIEVNAMLVMINLNQCGSNIPVRATKYIPEMSIFHGEVLEGPQSGEIIEINLDYEKEATHPETGERIPGIKRYLRQHSIKRP